jgi:hypothetical protein
VVPSNLHLELHKVYYVGVAVDLVNTSDTGVTFWVKDVSDMDAPLRAAHVKHNVTGSVASTSPFIIGGREPDGAKPAHGWDGLIGEVRLCSDALKPEQILWNEGDAKAVTLAHWRFEETPGVLKENGGRMPDLARMASGGGALKVVKGPSKSLVAGIASKVDAALIDLCHVLLNSNEFLYVD